MLIARGCLMFRAWRPLLFYNQSSRGSAADSANRNRNRRKGIMKPQSRRAFMHATAACAGLAGMDMLAAAGEKAIQGFDETATSTRNDAVWEPVSDRKIRVGIVGYGVCRFGAAFSFQDHPNVEVAAVSDLFPDRCSELAKVCRCEKTYPSLENWSGRQHRGRVCRDRCAKPSAPLHQRAGAWQARGLRCAGGVRFVGGRRPSARSGEEVGAEIHDVRDVGVPQ